MSHELRTPLNSILILGQQLRQNSGGNLSLKQVDFAKNITRRNGPVDELINDILDLSKIESGTVTVEAEDITFQALRDTVERSFHHLAESKSLGFHIASTTPCRGRSRAIQSAAADLKNLLSNASSSPHRAM